VYWRLTARQNLAFAAALQHRRDAGDRVEAVLATAGLARDADRPVSGFSQGMLRRLGLARALLHEPPVLLLDEPTRSLDPVARDEFHAVLAAHHERHGTTVVIATHDLIEAAALCSHVSVLRAGTVVERIAATSPGDLDAELRRLVS
jgi:ABC-type multidrug transport system ATPase subunit